MIPFPSTRIWPSLEVATAIVAPVAAGLAAGLGKGLADGVYGKIPRSFPEWTAAVAFIPSVGAQAGTGFADWGG